jgi:hypothetical protein
VVAKCNQQPSNMGQVRFIKDHPKVKAGTVGELYGFLGDGTHGVGITVDGKFMELAEAPLINGKVESSKGVSDFFAAGYFENITPEQV